MVSTAKEIIFDIQRGSFVDGPGIRTTVFFKGCNLNCKWCHNPESQNKDKQILIYEEKCTGCGKCRKVCPNNFEKCDFCGKCAIYCPNDAREVCGREYLAEEILSEILKDKSFYGNEGGVTFSGGECMLKIEFLKQLLISCKENGIHTAVDTAGNVPWESFEKILEYTDLFLYDVKCADAKLHKKWTGVDNRLILDNLSKLSQKGAKLWIRIPVISGVNDSELEMKEIGKILRTIKAERIELLPYHAMGLSKYKAVYHK